MGVRQKQPGWKYLQSCAFIPLTSGKSFMEVKMHYDSFRSIFVLVIQINKYLQQMQALNETFHHCKTYFFLSVNTVIFEKLLV